MANKASTMGSCSPNGRLACGWLRRLRCCTACRARTPGFCARLDDLTFLESNR